MQKAATIWPEGKRFAFTIVDDTDCATVENVKPVYDFLLQCGFLITKTVWPLAPTEQPRMGGDTIEFPEYCSWVKWLQARGMEIAYHGATDHTSPRKRTKQALDRFRSTFGHEPCVYTAHVGQREAMYWGSARLDGFARTVYGAANLLAKRDTKYLGEVVQSRLFWGDYCNARITYTRNFVTKDINTLKFDPQMPYHDSRRPYVRYWFSGSDGGRLNDFVQLIAPENQDRLLAEGGACVVYTHFGKDFVANGVIDPKFQLLMKRLASLPGWFVPARQVLDHLRFQPGWSPNVDPKHLRSIQWTWLRQNLGPSQWVRLCQRFSQSRRQAGPDFS